MSKCPNVELLKRRDIEPMSSCRVLEMSSGCRNVEMPSCRDVETSGCRDVEMSRCRDVELSRCRDVEMSRCRERKIEHFGPERAQTYYLQYYLQYFFSQAAFSSGHKRFLRGTYLFLEQQAHADRDQLIERYFSLGFTQCEICSFLVLARGIRIRILQSRGLRRRGHHTDLGLVISAIEQELEGSGSCIGYRAMWQLLRNDRGMVVSRETVRHALRIIDPEGVSERLRNRLRRRQYRGKGPNFLWHIDGYDKLKPFGVCI